jgi:NAD(P)-dependent dehydrogenase (short-subunit alcohol dehydrogenase family)
LSKTVLITGASRGLGRGLAREFASRGYRLALTARKAEDLDSLKAELQPLGVEVYTRVLDVVDYDQVPVVIAECAEELDGLDIVVVNAGVAIAAEAGVGKFEQMRTTFDVNLSGAVATCEAALAVFREQGSGQLVGITSIAALRGMRRQGAYCASKAGLSTYLESVRCETLNEAITVTELAPGYIDTDLNRALSSRPFLVTAERGCACMVDLIEKKSRFSYVPPWPWALVAQFLKILPLRLLRKM